MESVRITPRNIMFTQKMGETYDLNLGLILGKRHNFLIDTGLGSNSVAPAVAYLRGSEKPLIVINTHCHWDHIWGNWVFKNHTIVSHAKCRELEDRYWDEAYEEFKKGADGDVRKHLPNLVFEDALDFPEDGVHLFFTPGHSADGISVYDRFDRVLYAGDNIGDTAEVIVPYIDTSYETFRALLQTYRQYDFETCISGHNKPQGPDVVLRMERALDECWQKQLEELGPPG